MQYDKHLVSALEPSAYSALFLPQQPSSSLNYDKCCIISLHNASTAFFYCKHLPSYRSLLSDLCFLCFLDPISRR